MRNSVRPSSCSIRGGLSFSSPTLILTRAVVASPPIWPPSSARTCTGHRAVMGKKSAKCNTVRINTIICENPWIRDILVQFRILRSVSVPFTYRFQIKVSSKFFCLLRFEGTFTSAFKDEKTKELKSSRNQGFS
jgi:hypothetical protein